MVSFYVLENKVAIVTGASSGIGYATSLKLSKAGIRVAAGARRIDRLKDLEKQIIKNNGEIFIQKLDVTSKSICDSMVNAVVKKWGNIINISSVAGRIVFAGGSVYCATKHAITAFSEGLRKELSPKYNIRVTCIEPGAVSSELLESITDESMTGFIQATKNMETLQSDDIANAILYAIQAPNHVNVNEILIRPTAQER